MIIPVNLGAQGYDILLASGALAQVGRELNLDRNVLIVTDDGVPAAYGQSIAEQCKTPLLHTIPQGEASKSFAQYEQILSLLLTASFGRGDCVVAVGGGVVGDLSAFAASCYMRGIDFYNIPTTLLSQVDSSVGGKTAIDFQGVKNVVGTFYQPKKVIIDPEVLGTLDKRQLHAGLAEAIKMGMICDAKLFHLIAQSTELSQDLPEIIHLSVGHKRTIVEQDPKETGLRRVLNFGHTIGHGVESFSAGQLLHGECVALGMLPFCSKAVREKLLPVLEKYQLPTQIQPKAEELIPYLLHDKKRQGQKITVVVVEEIGSCRLVEMSLPEIVEHLESVQ